MHIESIRFMISVKTYIANSALALASVLAACVLLEIVYRYFLDNEDPRYSGLRRPELYADYFSDDDYWKLYYKYGGQDKVPSEPHPVLGWGGDFSRDTYLHNKAKYLDARRPVLLYGDSFAQCVKQTKCFQEILNDDDLFSGNNYLLNYGVGGFGTDQIFLLFSKSIHLYDNPFVIISFMVLDLDRSILSVRTGQKPYYEIRDNALSLQGIPIDPDPHNYFSDNPPLIVSYLYRRILYGSMLPVSIRASLREEDNKINKKKKVNERLILEIVKKLQAENIDYVFLIFHPHWPGVSSMDHDTWRDVFLKRFLDERQIPYIWSKDLIMQDAGGGDFASEQYVIPGNGHPTTRYNNIISSEIARHALSNIQ